MRFSLISALALVPLICLGQNQINQEKQLKNSIGSGSLVLQDSPTLTTPSLGAATATTGLIDTGAATDNGQYCLQIDSAGLLSNTGSACGLDSSGLVSATPHILSADVSTTSTTFVTTGLTMATVPANTVATGRCVLAWMPSSSSGHLYLAASLDNAPSQMATLTEYATGATAGGFIKSRVTATASGQTIIGNNLGVGSAVYFPLYIDIMIATSSSSVTPTFYFHSSSASYTIYISSGSYCAWSWPVTVS